MGKIDGENIGMHVNGAFEGIADKTMTEVGSFEGKTLFVRTGFLLRAVVG